MIRTTLVVAAGLTLGLSASAQATIIVGGPANPGVANVGNGNFEADSGGPLSFANVTNWHDIGGDDASTNFGHTTGMGGSPEPNSQGAFIFGHLAANDTGHTVAAAGEVFDIDFYLNRFGGGWVGDETVDVILFTSTTGVNAATDVPDITVLDTTNFGIVSGWQNYTQDGIYTTVAGDVGDTIYVAFDITVPNQSNKFPRLDVITWEVTPVPEPATLVLMACGLGMIATRRRK